MFTLGAVFVLAFLGLSTSTSHDAGSDHFETVLQDVMEHIVRNRRAIEWIDATGKTSLTQAEIKLIVDVHNSYRSVTEPTAADMIELTWDTDIANFAQTHLNKCTGKHNPDRKLDPWGSLGENMYFIPGNRYSDKQAMELWWVEGEDFVISSVTCNHQYTCNHFKAMAWAKTTKIGCGVKKCDVITENTNLQPPQTIFMCNYNKPVYSGAKPYTTGASCSACPAEFPKCRHNLCVTQAMLDSGAGFDGNTTVIGVTPIDNGGDGGDNGGGDGGENGGDGGNNGGGDGGDNGDSGDDDSAPFTASASYFVCLIFLSLAILLK